MTEIEMKNRLKEEIDLLEDDWILQEVAELLGVNQVSRAQASVLTAEQSALIAKSEEEIDAGECYSDDEVFMRSVSPWGK